MMKSLIVWCVWLSVGGPMATSGAAESTGIRSAEPESTGIPVEVLTRRRQALLERMPRGVAVLRSADSRDLAEHPQDSDFRQDNDFYYLTGLETPGSWLVLSTRESQRPDVTLYLPERDPAREMWTGPRLGPGAEAASLTGIREVRSISRFRSEVLDRLLEVDGDTAGVLALPMEDLRRSPVLSELAERWEGDLADLDGLMAPLRLVKDSVELARIRRAVEITVAAQEKAMRVIRPGMWEYEVEAVIEYAFRSRGAERVGFPSVVGSGPNSVILHYDENRRRMEAGELVVMDVGAEYGHYTADITRTVPVSGRFTPWQAAIYELVLSTQLAVIDSIRPGMSVWQLERIARLHMKNRSGDLCGTTTCDRYFVHGLSHWLGMDVHDVGSYATALEPGMVLTVEPGIYLPEESLGVRIEDDVLVTEDGREVLSAGAAKTVEEIEALMSQEEPAGCGCGGSRSR